MVSYETRPSKLRHQDSAILLSWVEQKLGGDRLAFNLHMNRLLQTLQHRRTDPFVEREKSISRQRRKRVNSRFAMSLYEEVMAVME